MSADYTGFQEQSVAASEIGEAPKIPASRAVSVVVPAFQEGPHVGEEIESIRSVLDGTDWTYDLIVVDDGSTDDTGMNAEAAGAEVVRHRRNRGYGASIKTGVEATSHPWILIIDADGTYPAEAIPELLERAAECEMVVGERTGKINRTPWTRRPAKWFLRRLASYLAGRRLRDLNSGLRLMRRSLIARYEGILPNGFSFTTTITLAAVCNDHEVDFVPISYLERRGRSSIRPRHAYDFLMLVLRTIVLFNPLKVFVPLGALLALSGLAKFAYDISQWDLSESAILALLAALVIWALGLLADQNSQLAKSR